jgi:hypothetical protein
MPSQYPTGFGKELVLRMLGSVAELVVRDDTGIPGETLQSWKHLGLVYACVCESKDLSSGLPADG